MSDLIVEPAAAGQAPASPAEPDASATPAGARGGTRRWLPVAATAATALIVGIAGTAVAMTVGGVGKAKHEYGVNIFLAKDVTEQQKAAIKASLTSRYPEEQIVFTDRQQASAEFQRMVRGRTGSTQFDDLPESFSFSLRATRFTCSKFLPVVKLAGVDQAMIARYGDHDEAAANGPASDDPASDKATTDKAAIQEVVCT